MVVVVVGVVVVVVVVVTAGRGCVVGQYFCGAQLWVVVGGGEGEGEGEGDDSRRNESRI